MLIAGMLVSQPSDKNHEIFEIIMVRRVHDCRAQSVVEGRWRGEGSCTSTVQHQGLVDGAEAVDFVVSTFQADLQLVLDSLEILDVACGSIKQGDFASLLVRSWEGFLKTGIPFPELVASALLGLDALLANSFTARVTRSRWIAASSNGSRFEFFVIFVVRVVVAPARPCTLVGGRTARPVGGHSNGVEAMRRAWDGSRVRDSGR
jgi:hypothetical protein